MNKNFYKQIIFNPCDAKSEIILTTACGYSHRPSLDYLLQIGKANEKVFPKKYIKKATLSKKGKKVASIQTIQFTIV
jgi:hypothetical protein